jgi:hypothetical protein
MGYFSGSSPQIKSGAVSALSVLVYKDADICLSMPDLVPSLLSLLHTKAVEVIKVCITYSVAPDLECWFCVAFEANEMIAYLTGCFGLCESISVLLTSQGPAESSLRYCQ